MVFGTNGSEHLLKGIRFAPLTGPGPSGLRLEHVQEALLARSRPITARLLRALARLEKGAAQGLLPDATMQWIMRSRLVFLKKKSGDKPRPIRIGEFFRRTVSKRMVSHERPTIQTAMKKFVNMV